VNLYLDTSVLVKLYVSEDGSDLVRTAVGNARLVATSLVAYVEARAAFARRRRERGLQATDHRRIVRNLDTDWPHFVRLEILEALIRSAARIAESHGLRAYDAVHLASAVTLRERLAAPVTFGCWDSRLESQARRIGLDILSH